MKRPYAITAAVVFTFVLWACSFIGGLHAAEIIYAEGIVQVQAASDKEWKKAGRGTKLSSGDTLRTARSSLADLVLDDEKKNTVRVQDQTLLVLYSSSAGLFDKCGLNSGKIYANIENVKASLTFEVNTPSSVVGVRGTGWSVVSDKKQDEVAVFKDRVNVKAFDARKNLLSEITVAEGQKTLIERFKTPGRLIQVSEREMRRWDQFRQEVSLHVEGKNTASSEFTAQMRNEQDAMEKITETKEEMLEDSKERRIEDIREKQESVSTSSSDHTY